MLGAGRCAAFGFRGGSRNLCRCAGVGKAAPEVEWAPTKGVVMGLRAIKDASELATMRAAIALADEALATGLAQVARA